MKPSEMTDEQLRIKVAELMGAKWSYVVNSEFETVWSLSLHHKEAELGSNWLAPGTYFAVHFIVANKPDDRFPKCVCFDVPDYPHDLNACRSFRAALDTLGKRIEYRFWLSAKVRGFDTSGGYIPNYKPANDSVDDWFAEHDASARQRCEAFVEVMSK